MTVFSRDLASLSVKIIIELNDEPNNEPQQSTNMTLPTVSPLTKLAMGQKGIILSTFRLHAQEMTVGELTRKIVQLINCLSLTQKLVQSVSLKDLPISTNTITYITPAQKNVVFIIRY